jgi:hypothetical protein
MKQKTLLPSNKPTPPETQSVKAPWIVIGVTAMLLWVSLTSLLAPAQENLEPGRPLHSQRGRDFSYWVELTVCPVTQSTPYLVMSSSLPPCWQMNALRSPFDRQQSSCVCLSAAHNDTVPVSQFSTFCVENFFVELLENSSKS